MAWLMAHGMAIILWLLMAWLMAHGMAIILWLLMVAPPSLDVLFRAVMRVVKINNKTFFMKNYSLKKYYSLFMKKLFP